MSPVSPVLIAFFASFHSESAFAGSIDQDSITAKLYQDFKVAKIPTDADDLTGWYRCHWRSAHLNNHEQGKYHIHLTKLGSALPTRYLETRSSAEFVQTDLGVVSQSGHHHITFFDSIRIKSPRELITETSVHTGSFVKRELASEGVRVPKAKVASFANCEKYKMGSKE